MDDKRNMVPCPHCGIEAPSENLLCIYCGESLNLKTGFAKGMWFLLIAGTLIVVFIVWLL